MSAQFNGRTYDHLRARFWNGAVSSIWLHNGDEPVVKLRGKVGESWDWSGADFITVKNHVANGDVELRYNIDFPHSYHVYPVDQDHKQLERVCPIAQAIAADEAEAAAIETINASQIYYKRSATAPAEATPEYSPFVDGHWNPAGGRAALDDHLEAEGWITGDPSGTDTLYHINVNYGYDADSDTAHASVVGGIQSEAILYSTDGITFTATRPSDEDSIVAIQYFDHANNVWVTSRHRADHEQIDELAGSTTLNATYPITIDVSVTDFVERYFGISLQVESRTNWQTLNVLAGGEKLLLVEEVRISRPGEVSVSDWSAGDGRVYSARLNLTTGALAVGRFNDASHALTNDANTGEIVFNFESYPSTRLNGAITADATSITVDSAAGMSVSDVLFIGSEQMQITAISGNALTVTRAHNSTTAAAHADNAALSAVVPDGGTFIRRINILAASNALHAASLISFRGLRRV